MVVDRLRRLPERAADLRARGRLGEVAQDLHALGLEQRVGLFDVVDVERVEHLQTQLYVPRDIPACGADRPRRHLRRAPPAGADDDLLQPGQHRGAVPRRAAGRPALRAGAARGVGGEHRGRLRARAGRARAGAAAQHARAGERGRGDRHRAPEPRAARGDRRPAGPAPPRAGARSSPAGCTGSRGSTRCSRSSRCAPQDVPGAIVRAYHAAESGRGPGARDRADGRLDRARAGAARDPRPAAAGALRGRFDPRRWTRWRRSSASGRRSSPGGRARSWPALVALAERLGAPVFQEPFGAAAGLPAGPSAVRRVRAGAPRTPARRCCAAFDTVLVVGTGALRQYPYDAGPLTRGAGGGHHRRSGRGAPQPGRAGRARRSRGGVRGAGGGRRARGPTAPSRSSARRPRSPASRSTRATCSPRWPSGSRATRSSSRSHRPAGRSSTPASRPPRRAGS